MVTLAIIGVVAALTIPAVINNYQKQQTVVKLKKVYNTLNQALSASQIDNGFFDTWEVGDFNWWQAKPTYEKYFKPYLKVSKVIGYYSVSPMYAFLNNNREYGWLSNRACYKVNLVDGTLIGFMPRNNNKIVFYVDINGLEKGPNKAGSDYFAFVIKKNTGNKLLPAYGNYTRKQITQENPDYNYGSCHKDKTGGGLGCTALIMYDGWQITDDYPW